MEHGRGGALKTGPVTSRQPFVDAVKACVTCPFRSSASHGPAVLSHHEAASRPFVAINGHEGPHWDFPKAERGASGAPSSQPCLTEEEVARRWQRAPQ